MARGRGLRPAAASGRRWRPCWRQGIPRLSPEGDGKKPHGRAFNCLGQIAAARVAPIEGGVLRRVRERPGRASVVWQSLGLVPLLSLPVLTETPRDEFALDAYLGSSSVTPSPSCPRKPGS